MTEREAICNLKCMRLYMLITDKKSEMKFNIANDMAIKALEKQISHKPITYKGTNRADCPICGNTVRGINKPFGDWCNKCGAKLDWSGK